MKRIKYLRSAVNFIDLAHLDYSMFRFENNTVEISKLKVKDSIRGQFSKSKSIATPVVDFYEFSEDNDFDIITDFANEIIEYIYSKISKVNDKYLVLNYLAYLLVKEDIGLYYRGDNLPLALLITELYASKRTDKLQFYDYSELVSFYRLKHGKRLFNSIIEDLRLERWNID